MTSADHVVVVNDEEQFSVWPAGRELPTGWRAVGEPAEREACLAWIREHWTAELIGAAPPRRGGRRASG